MINQVLVDPDNFLRDVQKLILTSQIRSTKIWQIKTIVVRDILYKDSLV